MECCCPIMYYTCVLLLATCGVTLSPDLHLQNATWSAGWDDPLRVDRVASDRVEVSWRRSGSWSDITNFTVSIIGVELQDYKCADNVTCNTAICNFSSRENCTLQPCTLYNLNVTGGDNVSEHSFTTAPAPPSSVNSSVSYRRLRVKWLGYLGYCHTGTVITVTTPHTKYKKNLTSAVDNGFCDQDLVACDTGRLVASVQVVGGDGQADEVSSAQDFCGEDAGSIVTNLDLLPGSRSIQALWSVKSDCARMTGYQVTWTPKDSEESSPIITGNTILSCNISGLSSCTEYTITVQPLEGNEFFTQPTVNASITEDEEPGPPTDVKSETVENESGSLKVSWSPPPAPGPQCPVTNNRVNWTLSDDWGEPLGQEEVGVTTTYTVIGLSPWTRYTVCVAAETAGGYGPAGHCDDGITDQDKPGPPSDAWVESTSASSLLVRWGSPLQPNGLVTGYTVRWFAAGGAADSHSTDNTTTRYIISGLAACTTYDVIVTASTIKGDGEARGLRHTTDMEAPPAPAQLNCKTPESSSSLTVTWVYPDTKCNLTKYLVVYRGVVLWSNNTYNDIYERPPSQSSYVDLNDLTPWTTYTVCVAGVITGDLVGDNSCCIATTLEAKPSAPESLEVVDISTNAISLSWDPPSKPNGQVTEYQLSLGLVAHNITTNTTTYVLTGLYPATHYNVTLKARNGAGWGQLTWREVETETTAVVGIVMGVVLGLVVVVVGVAVIVYRATLLNAIRKKTVPRPSSVEMSSSRVGATSDGEIKKCDLWSYIRNLESDTQRGLEEEFAEVKSQSPRYSTDAATRHINKEKNRFVDILPYDHSRVELSMVPGQCDSDYINASYIKDIHGRLFFVAAQGPKPETVGDFWRMVWELRVETIVMLTNLTERGREKCAQYWPSVEESRAAHDGYLLHMHAEEKDVHFTARVIEVTKGYQKRLVKQYHFTSWPDFGAPSHEDHLLDFITTIRSAKSTIGNHLLIHCSAGVGRTGSFIGLWNLMDMVDANTHAPTINIKRVVLEMRETRPSMVQSQEQYLYLYKCIAAYLQSSVMEAQEVNHVYDNPGYEEPIYMNT